MPYNSLEELPEAIQEIPVPAQEIWMDAYNGAYEVFAKEAPKERDARSAATAWSAIRKAGWEKDEATGKWKLTKRETAWMPPMHQKEFQKITEKADGGAVFHGAILWAEGNWRAADERAPVFYSRSEIAKTLKLWNGIPIWHDHPKTQFEDHQPADHIGYARDPRMDEGFLRADIHAHGATQASRDAIGMWQQGNLPDLSPELTSVDVKREGKLLGTTIRPYAVAWVIKGACTTCKVNREGGSCNCSNRQEGAHGEGACAGYQDQESKTKPGSDKTMEPEERIKELEAELKTSQAAGEELSTAKEAAEAKVATLEDAAKDTAKDEGAEALKGLKAEMTAQAEKIKGFEELKKVNDELVEKVKKLSAEPQAPKAKVFAEGGEVEGEMPDELTSQFNKSGNDYELKNMAVI